MVNVYPFDHKRIAEARAAGEATTAESNSAEDGEGDSLGRVPDYEEQLRALGYVE